MCVYSLLHSFLAHSVSRTTVLYGSFRRPKRGEINMMSKNSAYTKPLVCQVIQTRIIIYTMEYLSLYPVAEPHSYLWYAYLGIISVYSWTPQCVLGVGEDRRGSDELRVYHLEKHKWLRRIQAHRSKSSQLWNRTAVLCDRALTWFFWCYYALLPRPSFIHCVSNSL